MRVDVVYPALPTAIEVDAALAALPHLQAVLASSETSGNVRLRVKSGGSTEVLDVPRAALEVFSRVLGHMAQGEGVAVLPARSEVSTQQAADLLNVSRPYLIKLLDAGQIEYRLVGNHRRVTARSLLAYKRADDADRSAAADELTTLGQEMGLL